MILCRKRNFLFLSVPKTASTSLMHHILDHIPKNEIDFFAESQYVSSIDSRHISNCKAKIHSNLYDLINRKLIDETEVGSMQIFAIVRNPIERYLSGLNQHHIEITHSKFNSDDPNQKFRTNVSYDSLMERYSSFSANQKIFNTPQFNFPPQTNWLVYKNRLINNIIPYGKFDLMLSKIGVPTTMSYLHRSEYRDEKNYLTLSEKWRDMIMRVYENDWRIWNSVSY